MDSRARDGAIFSETRNSGRTIQLRMMFTCCHPAISPIPRWHCSQNLSGLVLRKNPAGFLTTDDMSTKRQVRQEENPRRQYSFEVLPVKSCRDGMDASCKSFTSIKRRLCGLKGNDWIRLRALRGRLFRLADLWAAHQPCKYKSRVYAILP